MWVCVWVGGEWPRQRQGCCQCRPATTTRLDCEEWSHVPLSGRCLDAVWTLSGRCLDAVWTLSGQAQDCLDICGSSTNQVVIATFPCRASSILRHLRRASLSGDACEMAFALDDCGFERPGTFLVSLVASGAQV